MRGRTSMARAKALAAGVLALVTGSRLTAQMCAPHWQSGFDSVDVGPIGCLANFDAGDGPHLYASVDQLIRRWDGDHWNPQIQTADSYVSVLRSLSFGGSTSLYAGGSFGTIAGVAASRVARWDGAAWSPLGAGVDGPVSAITAFDDGTGPALYIGGSFQNSGAQPVSRVARWTGAAWTAVGAGFNGPVHSLEQATIDGSTSLYAGGEFTGMGALVGDHIARWTGTSWIGVAGGLPNPVHTMAAFGGGLFVDGRQGALVSRFTGTTWTTVATSSGAGVVYQLKVHDDGAGPRLWALGNFTSVGGVSISDVARWNGLSWSAGAPGTMSGGVFAGEWFPGSAGSPLYIAGDMTRVGNDPAPNFATIQSGTVTPVTGSSVNDAVNAMTVADLGSGPSLFVGGAFTYAGHTVAHRVAGFDGALWSSLGEGMDGQVLSLAGFRDSAGPALYAGGNFFTAGGVPALSIARWDGSAWSALGAGLQGQSPNYGRALLAFDDGSGPALYVGGSFLTAGGVASQGIARWTGSSWQGVGGGSNGGVLALAVYDDGRGPALYAGGAFSMMGGRSANGLARWDGRAWTALDPIGTTGTVFTLAVYDDGTGPGLYAGGLFFGVGGAAHTNGIARWNGAAWSALGLGVDTNAAIRRLATLDDGNGEALYALGEINSVSGTPVLHIARWKDFVWTDLSAGGLGPPNAVAYCSAIFGGQGGAQQLVVGGSFTLAGGLSSFDFAELTGCPICYANCDHSTMPPRLNVGDFVCFINAFARGSAYANCDESTVPPALNVNDFACFINRFASGCP